MVMQNMKEEGMRNMNKEELACNIERIEKELASMKAQMNKSCNDLEIDYEGECYCINGGGEVTPSSGIGSDGAKQGRYRKTKKLAELASENMRKRDKLEEMAMWLDPTWRDKGRGTNAYYIYVDIDGVYSYSWYSSVRHLGKIYMSEKAAKRICDALNSGELSL